MKLSIDTETMTIELQNDEKLQTRLPFYSQEGFRLLSSLWVKQEWNQLHWQSFSWFGFQIWQFPEDLLRLQEVITTLKPDVIVETGLNHGGSAVFFASMCRLLKKGRVVSIDVKIREEVKFAIKKSPFSDLITLIEGDSTSDEVVKLVRKKVGKSKKVFVFLDSNHTKAHVLRELNAYSSIVTNGSYIVAADGIMGSLADTPRGHKEWKTDNPAAAALEFVKKNQKFKIDRPKALFNDQYSIEELTYWPCAWIERIQE